MQPEERDWAYLWDMREATRDVLEFTEGITYDHFCRDKVVRYAVERRIEVIGEAAHHVSETFKAQPPDIPWRRIIGQRNILAHEYLDFRWESLKKFLESAEPDFKVLCLKIRSILEDR